MTPFFSFPATSRSATRRAARKATRSPSRSANRTLTPRESKLLARPWLDRLSRKLFDIDSLDLELVPDDLPDLPESPASSEDTGDRPSEVPS